MCAPGVFYVILEGMSVPPKFHPGSPRVVTQNNGLRQSVADALAGPPSLPTRTPDHPKESRSTLAKKGVKLGRVVRDVVGPDLPLMVEALRDIALARGQEIGHGVKDRLRAMEMLFDRGWGRAHITVDVTNDDERPAEVLRVGSMSDDELALIVQLLESRQGDDEPPGIQ